MRSKLHPLTPLGSNVSAVFNAAALLEPERKLPQMSSKDTGTSEDSGTRRILAIKLALSTQGMAPVRCRLAGMPSWKSRVQCRKRCDVLAVIEAAR